MKMQICKDLEVKISWPLKILKIDVFVIFGRLETCSRKLDLFLVHKT